MLRACDTRRNPLASVAWLERLECRTLLSWSDFPTIADLLHSDDTVVRLQTNFGDIDLELFDRAAPVTVRNFLDHIRAGDYDKSFFHRLGLDEQSNPMALHGGAFRLHGTSTSGPFNGASNAEQAWEDLPQMAPFIGGFNQSNLARTLAMARTSGRVNTPASEFFINLMDNTSLDSEDGGFTVFGRIATDESWAVVRAIISGTMPSDQGGEFDRLPTRNGSGFTGDDVNEEQLVTVRDAEIIKARDAISFYTYRVYYPEGFAGSSINEFLPLGNPNFSALHYQVIARSETRDPLPADGSGFWFRDKVLAIGQIQGNRRAGITISTFTNPQANLVPRQGKPYGIEVWATDLISATLSHYDFGASAIEQFSQSPGTLWTIPDVRRGTDTRDFVVWSNATESPAAVTLTFHPSDGGTPIVISATTEAFRRGGISVGDVPLLADGGYSLQITSDVPLTAAISHYKTSGPDEGGSTSLAIPGSGAPSGVLPLASSGGSGSGVADTVTFFNPGPDAAAITLIAKFGDGTPDFTWSPAALSLAGGGRASYTIEDIPELRDRTFTLLYSSSGVSVFASTLHVEHDDVAASPFAYSAATRHGFGEGFMNAERAGDDLFEKLAVYNPNGAPLFSGVALSALVTVRFLFTDGTQLSRQFTVGSDENLVIDLTTFSPLLEESAHGRFYYSIDVVSDIPVVAAMSHYDTSLGDLQPSGGDQSNGTQQQGVGPLQGLVTAPVWLQLRIVPQTGGFGPGAPLTLAGPVNGPVSLGTTPQTRTMRFRVDYRIRDLDLTDDVHPAGLATVALNITGTGTGATDNATVSRATLSDRETFIGPLPLPGAADPGITGNSGDDPSDIDSHGRAGLAGPFRGVLPNQFDNDSPGNGRITGLSINDIFPFTLSASDQGLIGYDDQSGDPAYPLTGDEWYPLYAFMITAGDSSAGSVVFSTSLGRSETTGTVFYYYSEGDPQPRGSAVAYDASITVNIPAV